MKFFWIGVMLGILAAPASAHRPFFCAYWSDGGYIVATVRDLPPTGGHISLEVYGWDPETEQSVLLDATAWNWTLPNQEFRWTPNFRGWEPAGYSFATNVAGQAGWIVAPFPGDPDVLELNLVSGCTVSRQSFDLGIMPPDCGGGHYGDC